MQLSGGIDYTKCSQCEGKRGSMKDGHHHVTVWMCVKVREWCSAPLALQPCKGRRFQSNKHNKQATRREKTNNGLISSHYLPNFDGVKRMTGT